MSSSKSPVEPTYADRVFRSPAGMAGGVLLLGLSLWLGVDAVVRGAGRTPWFAVAAVLLAAPLIVAFTLRPAVFVNDDRVRVRNPFRTITLPWAVVEEVRASYTTEIITKDGTVFSMWAVPVSLRQRKKANRQQAKAQGRRASDVGTVVGPSLAQADQTVREMRLLAETNASKPSAQGETTIRWAYEILAPAIVAAVLLVILFALG